MTLSVDPCAPKGHGADTWKRIVSDRPQRAPTHTAQPNRHGANRSSKSSATKGSPCNDRRACWKALLADRARRDLVVEISHAFFRGGDAGCDLAHSTMREHAALMALSVLGRDVVGTQVHSARCDQPIFAGSLRSIFAPHTEPATQPRLEVELLSTRPMAKAA